MQTSSEEDSLKTVFERHEIFGAPHFMKWFAAEPLINIIKGWANEADHHFKISTIAFNGL